LTNFDKICQGDATRLSGLHLPIKIENSKNQDGTGRHLEKSLHFCNRLTNFNEIWDGDASQPL